MQKTIIILLLSVSCIGLSESIGEVNEIIIISSPEDQDLIRMQFDNLFSNYIHTPQTESEFNLRYYFPWQIDQVQNYGNIILTSLNFPEDSTADILVNRFLDKYNKNSKVVSLYDLYARDQLFTIIYGLDIIDLENIINNNREWILDAYRSSMESKLSKTMFNKGKNNVLSDKINSIIGHTIDLQIDYKLIRSDSLNKFIWVGRGYPYRWITLHVANKESYIDSNLAWVKLHQDFIKHIPEVSIGDYFKEFTRTNNENEHLITMRGVYEHELSGTGGPFFVYIFDTVQTNEVILISGFVSYPGNEKILLIKQLEIIAKTLHKGTLL